MKITIITVCFNSAQYIGDALRSIDAQTWPDIEHLIVDGGSTDDTLRIVAEHPQPWRHVTSEPDRGIYDAMNKGLSHATGEVVGLLNSDDFYAAPTVLAEVAAALNDTSVDVVYADLCYVAQGDVKRIVRYWRSSPFRPGLFARGWAPPHPTVFVRRRFFERFGGFDLSFPIAADMELMARLLEVHGLSARHLPRVIVHMRTGGTSSRNLTTVVKQNREIWKALKMHGLAASPARFIFHKLLSRGRQFTAKPG